MKRIKRPTGLIRYDSEKGISEGKRNIFNPRTIAYSVVLTILLVVVGTLFSFRSDFETTILRQRGTLFQEYGADMYSNIYTIEIVNKTRKKHDVEIKLLNPAGEIKLLGDPVSADKGEIGKGSFLALIKKTDLKSSNTRVKFGVYSDGELIEEYDATFVGPNSLDK
jgi:polyferredoxin